MKKLLCVLMFGMVFGQTELTTRVYNIDVGHGEIIDFNELTGYEFDYFILEILNAIHAPQDNHSESVILKIENSIDSRFGVVLGEYYPWNYDTYTWDSGANPKRGLFLNNSGNLVFSASSGYWNINVAITAEFPEEDTGYIEEGFDYCIDVGANLIASPCRDALPILDTLPSEIANNLTGIIGQGVAANNQNGNWMGSLNGLGGGNGYWFQSNVSACFNYNCAEN